MRRTYSMMYQRPRTTTFLLLHYGNPLHTGLVSCSSHDIKLLSSWSHGLVLNWTVRKQSYRFKRLRQVPCKEMTRTCITLHHQTHPSNGAPTRRRQQMQQFGLDCHSGKQRFQMYCEIPLFMLSLPHMLCIMGWCYAGTLCQMPRPFPGTDRALVGGL